MRAPQWFRWTLANALGGFIGAALGALLSTATFGLTLGPLVGIGLGLGQWLGLRRDVVQDWELPGAVTAVMWVALTFIGALIPGYLLLFALVLGATNGGRPPADLAAYVRDVTGVGALFAAVPGAVCGAGVGLAQGGLLRVFRSNMPVHHILAWTVATAAGWGASWGLAGGALGLLATTILSPSTRTAATPLLAGVAVLVLALSWGVTGVLTGAVLARLPAVPSLSPRAAVAGTQGDATGTPA